MQVIICVGASGSGKSTWCEDYVAKNPGTVIVSADHYFMQDGAYLFNRDSLGAAHARCLHLFQQALADSCPTILVDNTSTSRRERKDYIQAALEAGYEVWLKVFKVPAETCAARNCHGVPLSSIERQQFRITVPEGFYQVAEAC